MRRIFLLCLLCLLCALLSSSIAHASTGANTGITGLWEYPTAEMPQDGQGRFGFTKSSPYEFIFMDMAWLPWLEVNGRFTTFSSVYLNEGRRYMDKALDLKAILWHSKDPGKWFIPSVAFGVMDLMGTELMKAWYGVATWRWGDVALTAGYGNNRMNGFFAGIEWDIATWLTIKAEYSPLDYAEDKTFGTRILTKLPSKKYNAGVVLRAPWGMEGSISYQRGDEWAFTISQRFDLNGPFFGDAHRNFNTPGDSRPATWNEVDSQELLARIKSGLEKYTRVRDVDIKLEDTDDGHRLTLAYENYGYASHAEAMSRVLVVLAAVMPQTEELTLIAKNAGIPIVQADFPGEMLFDLRAHSLREEDSIHSAVFSWASKEVEDADAEHLLRGKAQNQVKAMLVYEPRIDQTLKEEYMDRWDIDLVYNGRYSNGFEGLVDVRFPIHVHADTTDGTGLWWEKDFNDKIRIQQAGMTWARHFGSSGRAWLFGEGGYLDEEWFGANLWGRYYGNDGSWWIGARLGALHDRDPYSFAGLTKGRYVYYYGRTYDVTQNVDEWRALMFAQAGYHFTDLDFDLQVDYGQFADGDKGYMISATRHWDDTAIGFWYIDTDVKAPDKDFTRAGVRMEIPADKWFGSWFGNSSSYIWEQNTMLQSSWNNESGRIGGIIRSPERMMSQLRPASLKRNVEQMLRDYCSYDDETGKENAQEITSILEYITR